MATRALKKRAEKTGKKPLPKRSTRIDGSYLDRWKYDGPAFKGEPHPNNDDLLLVEVAKAPDHAAFPKVNTRLCPPDTFYAYNLDTDEVDHMVSIDAFGTCLAWDTDRSGRYFKRADRPLVAPRSIEYCYDSSVALEAGEQWGVTHKNYTGTLGGKRPDKTPVKRELRSAPKHNHNPEPAPAKKGLLRKSEKPAPKKLLKKVEAVDDGGILDESGTLDHGKLNSAASNIADRLAGSFEPSKPLKPLKKALGKKPLLPSGGGGEPMRKLRKK